MRPNSSAGRDGAAGGWQPSSDGYGWVDPDAAERGGNGRPARGSNGARGDGWNGSRGQERPSREAPPSRYRQATGGDGGWGPGDGQRGAPRSRGAAAPGSRYPGQGRGQGGPDDWQRQGYRGYPGQSSPPQQGGTGGGRPSGALSRLQSRGNGNASGAYGSGEPGGEDGSWNGYGPAGGGRSATGLLPGRGSQYELPARFRRNGGGGGGDDGDDGYGPGGGRPRRKGDWWRRWTWKKVAGVIAACFGALIAVSAAGVAYAYSKTPIPDPQVSAMYQASSVYFSDGKTLIGKFGTVNRQVLQYQQIPPLVRNAVVAAEDKNFYHEGGISLTGILRAAYYDVTKSGSSLQGGSTITQQLVRNYYEGIGTAQTMSRKIKEIFVAEKLARVESKAWILTHYLNTVYFGNNAYGIGAAAQAYFGVPATDLSKLTPGQAAMIAAMIQSPSYYSPDPHAGAKYSSLVYRWHYVLTAMVKLGAITQQTADAQKFPTVVKATNNTWSGYRGYIMNRVFYELTTVYGYNQQQVYNDGLRIVTTVSPRLQNSLYASIRYNQNLMRHNNPPMGLAPAVTPDGLPGYVRTGALLENPRNGAILAMYSGPNYAKQQYDMALQARNQVGSSFKPYVLATAVKQGMSVLSTRLNGFSPLWIPPDTEPMTFGHVGPTAPPGGYNWYKVVNDEVVPSQGPVSVKAATAESLNTAFTDLWHRVALSNGQYNVVNMAKEFGVDTQLSGLTTMEDQAGTALGQASLTVQEQATMIATLADNGTWHTPHMIAEIIRGTAVTKAKIQTRQVLTPIQAADVDYAMSGDTVAGGTAAGMGLTNGQTVIAKTGTTNLAQSAFFLGATQKDAMAVGMFVKNPKCPPKDATVCQSAQALAYQPPAGLETLFGVGGEAGYGGQWPAEIWHTFFMRNFNNAAPMSWPPVNNYGTAWNLIGKLPKKPKPHKPKHQPQPPGCHHGGPFWHFHHHCGPQPTPSGSPTGSPTPSPSGSPTPTPSPTLTHHRGGGASTFVVSSDKAAAPAPNPLPDVAPAVSPSVVNPSMSRPPASVRGLPIVAVPAADSWLPRLRLPSP